jgi:hypothetical protein
MRPRAVAGRRHVDLVRIGFGIGDELGDRFGRDRLVDHHDPGQAHGAGDGRDVMEKIEIQMLVERRVGGGRGRDGQQRVSVGRRIHHVFGGDVGGGARAILDHEILAEPLRQRLRDQARGDVGRTGGGNADDDVHRPCRIIERRRGARQNG